MQTSSTALTQIFSMPQEMLSHSPAPVGNSAATQLANNTGVEKNPDPDYRSRGNQQSEFQQILKSTDNGLKENQRILNSNNALEASSTTLAKEKGSAQKLTLQVYKLAENGQLLKTQVIQMFGSNISELPADSLFKENPVSKLSIGLLLDGVTEKLMDMPEAGKLLDQQSLRVASKEKADLESGLFSLVFGKDNFTEAGDTFSPKHFGAEDKSNKAGLLATIFAHQSDHVPELLQKKKSTTASRILLADVSQLQLLTLAENNIDVSQKNINISGNKMLDPEKINIGLSAIMAAADSKKNNSIAKKISEETEFNTSAQLPTRTQASAVPLMVGEQSGSSSAERVQLVALLDKLSARLSVINDSSRKEVILQLETEFTGRLNVQLRNTNQGIAIRMMVENFGCIELLAEGLTALRDELEREGINFVEIELASEDNAQSNNEHEEKQAEDEAATYEQARKTVETEIETWRSIL
jgi:hypothetical protein